ncbi:cardiolipin synthase (CMP-forming) [Podarcis lilfordi]|uniref:Cardiolipin synthase (CMP-forming) n=1 Tax=Podarcis lilfordi TaxID=74358 RepID=A0AA35K2S2_9SAUR|nr:cardiolipin synthase (CMP-forming) [Podarcis lilfordi]
MLPAAWLAKGGACGWRFLRGANPARARRGLLSRAPLAAAASPPHRLLRPTGSRQQQQQQLLAWASCGVGGPAGNSERGAGKARPPRGYAELYENPWTIPNFLSMARIGLAPVLGYLIVEENFNIALGVFTLAGITDLLDGFIARNWANQKSALGSALDPLADKVLISVLYISLTCANLIPVPLTSMIILRDIALIAAVFYVRYRTLPPPRTLSRYFNPCYATAQLKPTFISKMNTVVQLILVAASLAAPVFNYVDSMYLQTLWCITAFTTTASAYSYYHYGRKTVQVLNSK